MVVATNRKITDTEGNDYLAAPLGTGNNTMEGGWGNDTIIGGSGDDLIIGGRISLVNLEDNNFLVGGVGNDSIYGMLGNDTLIGDRGNDVMAGSGGNNILIGGQGDDIFQFGYSTPRVYERLVGHDIILDFQHGDKIDLSALNYLGGSTDLAFKFIGEAAFSGTGPEVRVVRNWLFTTIELDTAGTFKAADGKVDFTISLFHPPVLKETDFIL